MRNTRLEYYYTTLSFAHKSLELCNSTLKTAQYQESSVIFRYEAGVGSHGAVYAPAERAAVGGAVPAREGAVRPADARPGGAVPPLAGVGARVPLPVDPGPQSEASHLVFSARNTLQY